MRIFGGSAELRESIVVFCFLTAFFPPIIVLQLPLKKYTIPLMKESGNLGGVEPFAIELLSSPNDLMLFLVLGLFSTALMV